MTDVDEVTEYLESFLQRKKRESRRKLINKTKQFHGPLSKESK